MYLRRIPVEDLRQRFSAEDRVWPASDSWHRHLRRRYDEVLARESRLLGLGAEARILNIGSRGSPYSFPSENHFHVDICPTSSVQTRLFVGADAHFLPFPSESFDLIVMIGSVINYCDASRLISECARCIRKNAILIFDFENLRTWEYWRHWQSNVALASTDYAGTSEKIWVYSPALMQTILATHQLTIERRVHLHTLTGLFLGVWDCEVLRRALAPLDRIWAAIPLVRNRAATIVLTCRKRA